MGRGAPNSRGGRQVDAALYALMAGMDPTAAIRALSEFAMLDPDTIQNKPGMLSSILKRHQAWGPFSHPLTICILFAGFGFKCN